MSEPAAPLATTAPRPRRRRLALFAAIAMLLALIAAIATTEVLLRTTDPLGRNYADESLRYKQQALLYVWDWQHKTPLQLDESDLEGQLYRHKPNLDVDFGSFRLRTNSRGFRGPELTTPKAKDGYRILLLGDSVAFGWGVDVEVTFAHRWAEELTERLGCPCEVVNTGHPGYDTNQELATLQDCLELQPDLVVLVYVVNDIEPTRDIVEQALMGRPADPKETLTAPGDLWTWLADRAEGLLPATATLLRLQSDEGARLLRTLPPGTEYVPERFGKGPRGWPRSQRALLRIRDLCAEHKLPLVLLDHTLPAVRALPDFCREQGIDYREFRFSPAELARPIRNSLLDSHANDLGHSVLLAKLRAIEPSLPLPKPRAK